MDVIVAERLVKLRKKHGLSQEALADKIGVSRQSVSKWERSEASPDTDNLLALAETYHITIDEMLYGNSKAETLKDAGKQDAFRYTTDAQNGEKKAYSRAQILLSYLPYILFPVVVNLMAVLGGWWHPGFLIVFGAIALKKHIDQKRSE